jgi:replication factor C large subunit
MTRLLEKYRPKNISDVIGNKKQIEEILGHVKNYHKGKPLMLHGPSGSGKNLVLELIARELNYELVELTASDFRDYQSIKQGILNSATQISLFSKGKIILVDDTEIADHGMMKGIREVVRESSFPVMLMAANPYTKQLYELRKISILVRFDKVRSDSMKSFLEKIAKAEGIAYEEKALGQLARMADGDVRSALIDLEAIGEVTEKSILLLGQRNFKQSVFDTLKIMLKTTDSENSKLAIEQSEKDPEEIFWWMEENIFREYEKPQEIAVAYEFLARADYFSCLIMRRQSWGLQKYVSDMMAFVSIAKQNPYRKFSMYQSPKFFARLGARRSADITNIMEKIGKMTHTSRKNASFFIPMLKRLSKQGYLDDYFTTDEKDALKEL